MWAWLRSLFVEEKPPAPGDVALAALRSEVEHLRSLLAASERREDRVREELLELIDRKAKAEVEHYRWMRGQAQASAGAPPTQPNEEDDASSTRPDPGPVVPWSQSLLANGHVGERPYPQSERELKAAVTQLAAEMGVQLPEEPSDG